MDENKRLRKRLNRNKIRAVILERQKKEIIRLKSDRKGQLLAQRNIGRDTYVRDDMLIGSPLETRSKGAQRSKAIAPSISLRKDSNLKRHNYNSQKMSHAFSGGNLIIRNSSGL